MTMRLFICFLLLSALPLLAEEAPQPNYVFRAELVRVIDGGTVALNIDLGFGVWTHNQSLGLLGVEEPAATEAGKEQGLKRATKLRELLKGRAEIIVQTVKDKKAKPARYLAVIWADGTNVNEEIKKAFP